MGSIPVGDSDVFFVPRSCHVDEFTSHKNGSRSTNASKSARSDNCKSCFPDVGARYLHLYERHTNL